MKIFIDWTTGTWGSADRLVIMEADEDLIDDLTDASDSTIRQIGADEWHAQRGMVGGVVE